MVSYLEEMKLMRSIIWGQILSRKMKNELFFFSNLEVEMAFEPIYCILIPCFWALCWGCGWGPAAPRDSLMF